MCVHGVTNKSRGPIKTFFQVELELEKPLLVHHAFVLHVRRLRVAFLETKRFGHRIHMLNYVFMERWDLVHSRLQMGCRVREERSMLASPY